MVTVKSAIERSDVAVKRLLRQQLAVMEESAADFLDGNDGEPLHNYRVALRRSRTLLDELPEVLPQRIEGRYSSLFAQIGALTTPLRDLDVLLLNFERYRALLPEGLQPTLQQLRGWIEMKHRQQRQPLIEYLQSADYRYLVRGWQTCLGSAPPPYAAPANAKRSLQELANGCIWKLYRRIVRLGDSINQESPATALHTLRKRCKRLRYLMEFFQPLYPEQKIERLIAVLQALQDYLGAFQDLQAHHIFFRSLRAELGEERQEAQCQQALSDLAEALEQHQCRQRQRFQSCYRIFASDKQQQRFKALFKP